MDLQKVHSVVNRFQKGIFRNSSFFDSGFFASSFKGAGLQFKEHQVYNYGDEVRFIDWKLLARKNTPYIKTFEEERNVEVKIIVDCHPNFILSHDGKSKFITMIEMCAILILFAGKTKDKVSFYLVGNKIIRINNLSGEDGLIKLIARLGSIGLLNDDGKPIMSSIFDFCNNKFDQKVFKKIGDFKKGPFVIFSPFNDGQYGFFEKLFMNKNTHMFKLNCPFENEVKSYRFLTGGLKYITKLLDKEDINSPATKIINIKLESTPLIDFVEGIRSNESRI